MSLGYGRPVTIVNVMLNNGMSVCNVFWEFDTMSRPPVQELKTTDIVGKSKLVPSKNYLRANHEKTGWVCQVQAFI
jgi:hypothetical protein